MQFGNGDSAGRDDPTVTSLADLLSLADERLVESAYWTVLGRAADPEGRDFYTACLRRGDAPLRVLAALRRSREGALAQANLPGLDRMLLLSRLTHLPVVGALVSYLTGVEGNTRAERTRRRLENRLARLEDLLSGAMVRRTANAWTIGERRQNVGSAALNAYIARIAFELGG